MRRVTTSVHASKQFGTPQFFAALGKGTTRKPRENAKLKREKPAGMLPAAICTVLFVPNWENGMSLRRAIQYTSAC